MKESKASLLRGEAVLHKQPQIDSDKTPSFMAEQGVKLEGIRLPLSLGMSSQHWLVKFFPTPNFEAHFTAPLALCGCHRHCLVSS